MKKTLSILAAILFIATTAWAQTPIENSNLTWELQNDTLTIAGTGAMPDFAPSTVAPWHGYSFKTAIIENGVTSIGIYAFYDCTALTSISIPNSVTSIGRSAFNGCSGLTSITIPNLVTTIGNGTFYGCSSLTSITIPNLVTTIEDGAFLNCSGLTTVNFNAVNCAYYADYSGPYKPFYGCTALTTVNFGNEVKTIPDYAFYGCSGLTSVTIPNSVTSIRSFAFAGCSGLTGTLTIPNSVTSIGNAAFSGCSGLSSITIPNSVTTIGESAFSGCNSLTSLHLPENLTIIGDNAFSGCNNLTSLHLPENLTAIGDNAFYNCTGISEIYVKAPEPVAIQANTFYNVSNTIPVYVSCGSAEKYMAAAWWNNFRDIQDNAAFRVTLRSSNPLMGTARVVQAPCESEIAIIDAVANSGYRFVRWNDGNTANPRTITVTEDISFTAEFALDNGNTPYYTVTVTANNRDMGSVVGSGSYAERSTATLVAVPNTGYRFVQWQDGNTENPRTITITENVTYTAEFEIVSVGITSATQPKALINVYPNPTTGLVYIETGKNTLSEVSIYTAMGKLIRTVKGNQTDLSDLPSGVYILQVGNQRVRVVKQ